MPLLFWLPIAMPCMGNDNRFIAHKMPVLFLCYSTLFVGVRVIHDLLLDWVNQKRKSQSIEIVEICIAQKNLSEGSLPALLQSISEHWFCDNVFHAERSKGFVVCLQIRMRGRVCRPAGRWTARLVCVHGTAETPLRISYLQTCAYQHDEWLCARSFSLPIELKRESVAPIQAVKDPIKCCDG